MITKFKIFWDPVKGREKYLNKMADKGFRLFRSKSFYNQFNEVNNKKYKYSVEYIGHLSNKEREDYIQFLEDLGIRSFSVPMNLGKIAIGNVRLRAYAKQNAAIATSKGMIGREIIIAEKVDDGKPFEMFSNAEDKINHLKEIRKPYIYLFVFAIIIIVWNIIGLESYFKYTFISYRTLLNCSWTYTVVGCILAIFSVLKLITFSHIMKSIRK